ncbi:MAG: glycosyltransferase family 1 protein [Verrucomicrobiota bacterium]
MKVCIDIQSAIAQRAGVGRYTKSLVEHLGPAAEGDELRLFYFDFKRKGLSFPVNGAREKAVRWLPGRLAQKAWKELGWPPFDWFSGRADLFHFPNFIRPPLSSGRSVVTIHDVSFLRVPETTEERNLEYLNAQIRRTVDHADAIITDSEFSSREMQELLKLKPKQIFPIHLGLDPAISRPAPAAMADHLFALNLDRPYLLTVGTLEPRKNHLFLLDLFERLESFDGDLVIAGMRGWKYEPILERMKNSSRAENIRYLEFVPDKYLASLYAGAQLFLFPSIYEGFGFPPLEAMACGAPVVSASAGSLAEVLGEAARVIDGHDLEAWTESVSALLNDEDEKARMREAGCEHARTFQWSETARQTWEVYRTVAG